MPPSSLYSTQEALPSSRSSRAALDQIAVVEQRAAILQASVAVHQRLAEHQQRFAGLGGDRGALPRQHTGQPLRLVASRAACRAKRRFFGWRARLSSRTGLPWSGRRAYTARSLRLRRRIGASQASMIAARLRSGAEPRRRGAAAATAQAGQSNVPGRRRRPPRSGGFTVRQAGVRAHGRDRRLDRSMRLDHRQEPDRRLGDLLHQIGESALADVPGRDCQAAGAV